MQSRKNKMLFGIQLKSMRNLFKDIKRGFSVEDSFEMTKSKFKSMFWISFFLFSFSSVTYSQWKHELFPSDMNIQPFTANFLEPKAGFLISLNNSKLRLDISTSRDIVKWFYQNESFSIGADVFTFTRLRSTDDFKFPVETIDYLFGFNAGYKKILYNDNEIGLRFRLSHISAHLVDGQFDAQSQQWREGRDPFVFSKEFVEFFPYYRISSFRMYAGLTYIFHIIPKEIKKGIFQFGFDYYAIQFRTDYLTPFIAYDFKLTGNIKYAGNNIVSGGIKFGKWNARGLSLYVTYISGKSIHGEYFDVNENYTSIGFNFDL